MKKLFCIIGLCFTLVACNNKSYETKGYLSSNHILHIYIDGSQVGSYSLVEDQWHKNYVIYYDLSVHKASIEGKYLKYDNNIISFHDYYYGNIGYSFIAKDK